MNIVIQETASKAELTQGYQVHINRKSYHRFQIIQISQFYDGDGSYDEPLIFMKVAVKRNMNVN